MTTVQQASDEIVRRAKIKKDMPVTKLELSHTEACRVLPDRTELLRHLPRNGVAAEIGAAFGDYTSEIMEINRPQILHLVDVWSSDRYRAGLEKIRARFGASWSRGGSLSIPGCQRRGCPSFPMLPSIGCISTPTTASGSPGRNC